MGLRPSKATTVSVTLVDPPRSIFPQLVCFLVIRETLKNLALAGEEFDEWRFFPFSARKEWSFAKFCTFKGTLVKFSQKTVEAHFCFLSLNLRKRED